MGTLTKVYCRSYQKVMKVASSALNWTPPKVVKGAGAVKQLPELVKAEGLDNVLIVTDKGLMSLHLLDGLFEGHLLGEYEIVITIGDVEREVGVEQVVVNLRREGEVGQQHGDRHADEQHDTSSPGSSQEFVTVSAQDMALTVPTVHGEKSHGFTYFCLN